MSSDLISRLSAVKAEADGENTDRENYRAYVADRVEHGGWSAEDVAEYKAEAGRIMTDGTDDEKDAAREFWEHKRHRNPDVGINDRIRASIAAENRLAA